ncbi:MAG: hypothetical protein JWO94_2610 [Verrucomicrobiaceae bacterium]|nr:hypothetical protein [Verrucomicrobiaceae bacterium]
MYGYDISKFSIHSDEYRRRRRICYRTGCGWFLGFFMFAIVNSLLRLNVTWVVVIGFHAMIAPMVICAWY